MHPKIIVRTTRAGPARTQTLVVVVGVGEVRGAQAMSKFSRRSTFGISNQSITINRLEDIHKPKDKPNEYLCIRGRGSNMFHIEGQIRLVSM